MTSEKCFDLESKNRVKSSQQWNLDIEVFYDYNQKKELKNLLVHSILENNNLKFFTVKNTFTNVDLNSRFLLYSTKKQRFKNCLKNGRIRFALTNLENSEKKTFQKYCSLHQATKSIEIFSPLLNKEKWHFNLIKNVAESSIESFYETNWNLKIIVEYRGPTDFRDWQSIYFFWSNVRANKDFFNKYEFEIIDNYYFQSPSAIKYKFLSLDINNKHCEDNIFRNSQEISIKGIFKKSETLVKFNCSGFLSKFNKLIILNPITSSDPINLRENLNKFIEKELVFKSHNIFLDKNHF